MVDAADAVVEAHAALNAELAVLERLRARLDGLAEQGSYEWSGHDRLVFSGLDAEGRSLQGWVVEYLHGTACPVTAPDPVTFHGRLTTWLERSRVTRGDVHGFLRRVLDTDAGAATIVRA